MYICRIGGGMRRHDAERIPKDKYSKNYRKDLAILFTQIEKTKTKRKSSYSQRTHTEKAVNSMNHIWAQRSEAPGWELPIKKPIQRIRVKKAEGQEMEEFDTENLLNFQQALNVLHLTRKNPIFFVSRMIKQLKKTKPPGYKEALQMCKTTQHVLIRTHGSINIDAAETIVDSDEFDVFVGDWDTDDNSLVSLFAQAYATAAYINDNMNDILTVQENIDQCIFRLTNMADQIIKRVFFESLEILDIPKNPVAVYAVGSFGRMELMPASDLDFGVIGLDDEDMQLVRNIANLMAIKVNFAREIYSQMQGLENSCPAKFPAGFQADPLWLVSRFSITPKMVVLDSLLKGTPQDARFIIQINEQVDELQKEFEAERYAKVPEEYESELCNIVGILPDSSGIGISQVYNIKEKWIRPLTLIMQKLNYIYGLQKGSTIERIEALSERGILPSQLKNCILESFRYVLQTRWKIHARFKVENDNIAFISSDNRDAFILDEREFARFVIIDRDFNKLYSFIENLPPIKNSTNSP